MCLNLKRHFNVLRCTRSVLGLELSVGLAQLLPGGIQNQRYSQCCIQCCMACQLPSGTAINSQVTLR